MTDLLSLANEIEAVESGSRELDARIGIAFGITDSPSKARKDKLKLVWSLPHYTTSADAALSLVPEGYRIIEIFLRYDHNHGVKTIRDEPFLELKMVKGNSIALAISAASLRALAQGGES